MSMGYGVPFLFSLFFHVLAKQPDQKKPKNKERSEGGKYGSSS